MKTNSVNVPVSLKVRLANEMYAVKGTYDGYTFDHVYIRRVSKSRVYFVAIKNGLGMVEVPKQMKFRQGKVTVKFGRTELVIGSYTEVFQ